MDKQLEGNEATEGVKQLPTGKLSAAERKLSLPNEDVDVVDGIKSQSGSSGSKSMGEGNTESQFQ